MEIVFNRVLIKMLLSGIAVCSPAMGNSATGPLQSANLDVKPEGSGFHDITQERPKIPVTHDGSLNMPARISSSERKALSQYGPWVTEKGISINAEQLIDAIQNASIHGLNPEAYGLSSILETSDALVILSRYVSDNTDSVDLLSPDIELLRTMLKRQLNAAFTRLSEHLGQGVVDAITVQNRLFRQSPVINAHALLDALTSGTHNVATALNSVVPAHPEYRRLTRKMRDLLTEQATDAPRTIVKLSDHLSDSERHNNAINLQTRLLESGDLALGAELSSDLTTVLHDALRSFQSRHGIPVTGDIDEHTIAVLDLSIADKIKTVALSLERWRWMPRNLGSKHVLVNIPEYRAVVRSESKTLLSMDVVVGSVKYQTPAFSRDMSYMDFNPGWIVPQSIANRELIPLERKQPGYLASRNFDILKNDGDKLVKVPREQVTTADLAQDRFPYTLRQRGGAGNVLGKVKFMMPNPYRVYLHDTHSKEQFTLEDRAFSNGCVRLSEPEQLAKVLMLGDGYTEQDVTKAFSSVNTRRIKLRTPVPTHMTYLTTWVDENNLLHRRKDVYSYDEALVDALEASDTLLSNISSSTISGTSDPNL